MYTCYVCNFDKQIGPIYLYYILKYFSKLKPYV